MMRSLGWVYLIFVAHLVSATVTGPNYAGTVGTSPSGPATWSNTANAQGSTSDNYATVTITGSSGTQSEYLTLTNFGIDIPTGFQVAGVVVEIRWRRSGVNPSFVDATDATDATSFGGEVVSTQASLTPLHH